MTKIVIIDASDEIRTTVVKHTGAEHRRLANLVMEEALQKAQITLDDLASIVATGYGRINVPFADKQLTELTCHARGTAYFFPNVKIAIDIGGQDAKVLKIKDGKLVDFIMNDKCAAGTGRFLDIICQALGLKIEDLGEISMKSANPISITNVCTIFAQQEIINLLSTGVKIEDIISGLHYSIASRITGMMQRFKIEPDVVFTGGVALNTGISNALTRILGFPVLIPGNPLISGALGAALLGKDFLAKNPALNQARNGIRRTLDETTFFKAGL